VELEPLLAWHIGEEQDIFYTPILVRGDPFSALLRGCDRHANFTPPTTGGSRAQPAGKPFSKGPFAYSIGTLQTGGTGMQQSMTGEGGSYFGCEQFNSPRMCHIYKVRVVVDRGAG
jgi:hypothetical protein